MATYFFYGRAIKQIISDGGMLTHWIKQIETRTKKVVILQTNLQMHILVRKVWYID